MNEYHDGLIGDIPVLYYVRNKIGYEYAELSRKAKDFYQYKVLRKQRPANAPVNEMARIIAKRAAEMLAEQTQYTRLMGKDFT